MIRFWQDKRGSVAIIVALSAMLLVVIAGAAVDFATAYYVRVSLQSSLDSASLAAGRLDINPNDTIARKQQQLTAEARNVFNANLDLSPGLVTVQPLQVDYTPPVGTTPDTVTVSVEASIPTNFLRIAGIPQFNLTVSSKAQRPQPGPIDLALVLDTTGSMSRVPAVDGFEPKLTTLKTAARELVEKLMAMGSPNIQLGVVPYTSYVNVNVNGALRSPVPDWVLPIDRDYCTAAQYQYPDRPCTSFRYDCKVDGVDTPNGCVGWDCSARGKATCASTARSTWSGCIGARTVLSNNPANMWANPTTNPDTYGSLDDISSPTSPKYSGQSIISVGGLAGASGTSICPAQIVGLTSIKQNVLNSISGLVARGETHIPTGLIWGWNVLAPGEPYAARTADDPSLAGGRKVLLLMTDGINANSPRFFDGALVINGNTTIPLAWRNGTKTNELTTEICNNIRADGIQIFTVLFDVPEGSDIEGILHNCASPKGTNPTQRWSFKAKNKQELLDAFRDISDELDVLKLLK